MNSRRLIACVSALLLIGMVLVAAMPALATPPDQLTVPIGGSFIVAECDGFNVIDEYSGWITFMDFYDNNGDLVRSDLHAFAHDRIYNSVTGFEVANTFAYNQTIDPETNVYFIRGLAWNITVPGYGIVYFDSGLGIFVVVDGQFIELQFSGNLQLDEELLCEAMDQ